MSSQFTRVFGPVLSTFLFLSGAGSVTAAPCGVLNDCKFVGEIVSVPVSATVRLWRADGSSATARTHTALCPGDTIKVFGDVPVFIVDEPSGRPKAIGSQNGRYRIEAPKVCEHQPDVLAPFKVIEAVIQAIFDSPLAAEPRTALPRGGGEPDSGDIPPVIRLAGKSPQLISADLSRFVIVWAGPRAHGLLRDAGGRTTTLAPHNKRLTWATADLNHGLDPGDVLKLSVVSQADSEDLRIEIVPPSELPRPAGLNDLEGLSERQRTLYAIWLAVEGSPEWRLQALSLLHSAANSDYLAMKVFRKLLADWGE